MVNSGLVVKEIHVRIEGEAILLWIESCVYTDDLRTPRTTGVVLNGLRPGRYTVQYSSKDGGRDEIGAVLVEE